jgi:hypothetical protein
MPVKIEHRVGIKAPAEEIWAVISDINGWTHWNPIYTRAEGVLRIGAALSLDLTLADRKTQTIQPVILDWIPNEQIHWRLTALGGLVRTTRYLEIEKLAETACIFANGEVFDGPLGPLAVRSLKGAVRAGFRAMGEALKERVESRWQSASAMPRYAR